MSDPRRVKVAGRIKVKAKLSETGEIQNLYTFVDDHILKTTPTEVIEDYIKQDLNSISDKPHTVIYKTLSSFSYSDKDAMKEFDFGNVFVEVYLPYCLHLPNYFELLVSIPEQNINSFVILEKIWTYRAEEEGKKSDNIDYYAENYPLYFKSCSMIGPKLPIEEQYGCEPNITGRNVEKVYDQNGVFRYSKLFIQLELDLPDNIEKLNDKIRNKLFDQVRENSLQVINRIIDTYREATNEIHVRRLGEILINLIYFKPQNLGFYITDLNISTAMINRSRKEIREIQTKLAKGSKPEFYKMLLLNAKSSVQTKDFTQAIVESFQALEIFLENYIIAQYKNQGLSETQFIKRLDKTWRTKDRLNKILFDLKGKSLNKESDLWNKWCLFYDKTRNEVIHFGKEPTEKETKETLEINEKVINWILTL